MRKQGKWSTLMLFLTFLLGATDSVAAESFYDPLAVTENFTPQTLDLTVHNGELKRDFPIRVYLPSEKSSAPIVLFSHGLGGSREGSGYLGKHWAARGYVAVFVQHPGSDTSVWRENPPEERIAVMKRAAGPENLLLRVKDIHGVLDQLERWDDDSASGLSGRLDLRHVGMSGHSFGALTTQAVSGQKFPVGGRFATDLRIKAALLFSPSAPRRGDPKEAFGNVSIPWMLMTGTKDVAPIGDVYLGSRLAVFPALPPGGKYELVLYNAEHSAFADRSLPGDRENRNPNHHRAILALSTAFWDACLRGRTAAKDWLDGDGPRSVLEKQDRWQAK